MLNVAWWACRQLWSTPAEEHENCFLTPIDIQELRNKTRARVMDCTSENILSQAEIIRRLLDKIIELATDRLWPDWWMEWYSEEVYWFWFELQDNKWEDACQSCISWHILCWWSIINDWRIKVLDFEGEYEVETFLRKKYAELLVYPPYC